MQQLDQVTSEDDKDAYASEYGGCAMSYPELCSEFLRSLVKSIKNTALYTLSHPVVIESLHKDLTLLGKIFSANKYDAITLSFVNDSWLFNDTSVPAVTQESQNLNAFFKARHLQNLTFMNGIQPFELGTLCEFLGIPPRNSPERSVLEFFAEKGVRNILPEAVHYIRGDRDVPQSPAFGDAVKAAPGPAAAAPQPHSGKPAATVPQTMPRVRTPEAADHGKSALASMSFSGILKGLVESTVKDPKDRLRAYEDALQMVRDTMEQQVAESTKGIAAEKERILNTRARTERVLSRVAEGKVVLSKEGKVLMMNPAAEEIAGMKLSDAAGKHISAHMKPGTHFLTMSKDLDLSEGTPITGEVEMKGDEGMGRALRRSVALLEDDEGRVVGAYSTLPGVMQYKEMQRMQEEFLSRVTHDLQSPLSSITSALEMLTEASAGKFDVLENKFLDISIRNSRRLGQMIRGILDFSKLQSGKMDVRPEPVPVATLLSEAGEALMPWAKTKELILTVRPVPPDMYVMADLPRMVQVITNLISNAIKATPKGGTIIVAAAPDPGRKDAVMIGVRDTGRGIPEKDLSRIFEKFVQLSSRESQGGIGLGLAIVKDILTLHNGRIWAVSEVGKGSTFYFTLPRALKTMKLPGEV